MKKTLFISLVLSLIVACGKNIQVSSVLLNQSSATLIIGDVIQLTASVHPADAMDKTVIWSTSDASVATVKNGNVSAIKKGTATITARAGNRQAQCQVTVQAFQYQAGKAQQEEYRQVCGKCYNKKYLDYICVDEMGTLISPHYLTSAFPKLLEKNGLRKIRFHDLRHSCASLLLTNGVSMKQIQEWLGHSDFSTTANVYAHLDFNSKLSSADAMVAGLQGALNVLQ